MKRFFTHPILRPGRILASICLFLLLTSMTVQAQSTLGGTVTISGTAKFDEILTAETTGLTSTPSVTLGTLSYQWKRGGADITGATNATYKLVQDDIGATITVTVTTANCLGDVTSVPTAAVAKADQMMPPIPSPVNITATSIMLNTIAGAEYSIDNGTTWQDSPTFTGLTPVTPYTFCVRFKETATHNASVAGPLYAAITTLKKTDVSGSITFNSGSATATFTVNKASRTATSAPVEFSHDFYNPTKER